MLSQTVGGDVKLPVHVVSYGLSPDAQWRAENISRKGVDGYAFVVKCGKQVYSTFETRLPGIHNVSNALGAIAVGSILSLPLDAVRRSVAEFQGVRRRFQPIGEAAGVTVMDDYAHHPTEVRATLAAARQRFPGRRLVCLFQPHTYTRTQYLLDGFRTCFEDCDVLLIAETYAAREEPSAGMSAEQLAPEIGQPGACYAGDLNQSAKAVTEMLEHGDVFFTIGAGDVEKVGPMVLEALKAR
jgi:UDP-N-acetylmuramate--alanine ligase